MESGPGIHSTVIRRTACWLIVLFLFNTANPLFAQDSPPEPVIYSLEQAEALYLAGLAEESLKMLEKLEPEMSVPEQKIRFYLLRARDYLALADKESAEHCVREIFKRKLFDRIQLDSLEKELVFLFEKVRPEYWFALKEEKRDEEKFDRLVIQQYRKKPNKKKLIPTLILGAVLIGAVVAAVLFITSGSNKEEDNGDFGTLKFENCNYWDVTIEILGIVKTVPGTNNNSWYFVNQHFLYMDLSPGTHTLTVTSTNLYNGETEVFVYSVKILTGLETHFTFIHL